MTKNEANFLLARLFPDQSKGTYLPIYEYQGLKYDDLALLLSLSRARARPLDPSLLIPTIKSSSERVLIYTSYSYIGE